MPAHEGILEGGAMQFPDPNLPFVLTSLPYIKPHLWPVRQVEIFLHLREDDATCIWYYSEYVNLLFYVSGVYGQRFYKSSYYVDIKSHTNAYAISLALIMFFIRLTVLLTFVRYTDL